MLRRARPLSNLEVQRCWRPSVERGYGLSLARAVGLVVFHHALGLVEIRRAQARRRGDPRSGANLLVVHDGQVCRAKEEARFGPVFGEICLQVVFVGPAGRDGRRCGPNGPSRANGPLNGVRGFGAPYPLRGLGLHALRGAGSGFGLERGDGCP